MNSFTHMGKTYKRGDHFPDFDSPSFFVSAAELNALFLVTIITATKELKILAFSKKGNSMKLNGKKYVVLEVDNIVHETDEAVLTSYEAEEIWIPKSQLEDWPDVGESGEIIVTEWFLTEKGYI